MEIIGLLTRPEFKSGVQFAQQILAYLEMKKRTVVIPPHLANALKRPELACPIEEMKADVVITLGGDGTTLYAAQHLPSDIPLLPVNLESFGFLSECEIQDVEALLDQVLAGQLAIQETSRLGVWLKKKRLPDAANEAALFPINQGRPTLITVQLNKSTEFEFRANGFIIATPMGSTGHTLSLGGPILDLHLEGILLFAVAPLRHSFLPLIIPRTTTIEVQLGRVANLYIDGEYSTEVNQDTPLTVKHSESSLRILRRSSRFYTRLQGKLLGC